MSERSREKDWVAWTLNTSTVMYNPELFNALAVTRAGGNDPLFDQMFAGIRLSGVAGHGPRGEWNDEHGDRTNCVRARPRKATSPTAISWRWRTP